MDIETICTQTSLLEEKIKRSIQRIVQAHNIAAQVGNSLILAYSGGKDSDILLDLAIKSGVPFEVQHNHTTVDAPETVYHIRAVFKHLNSQGITTKVNFPPEIVLADGKVTRATMWNLIPKKLFPPTRIVRYCCEYFKERRFDGQHIMTGIRWAESAKRKNGRGVHEKLHKQKERRVIYMDENDDAHKLFEICHKKVRAATNPIIDFTDQEVWTYIQQNNIVVNPLYALGFSRVGCIGCPMNTRALREFERYPKYKAAYLRAFEQMRLARERRGRANDRNLQSAETIFRWWTEPKFDVNQTSLLDQVPTQEA